MRRKDDSPLDVAKRGKTGKAAEAATGKKAARAAKIAPGAARILRSAAPGCARALVEMAADTALTPRERCMAIEAVLDRVYGKASQPIEANLGDKNAVVITFAGKLGEWSK